MPRPCQATLLPSELPENIFRRLAQRRGVFWLDSSLHRGSDGRYSIIGCEPRTVFIARGNSWTIRSADGSSTTGGDTLRALDQWLAAGAFGHPDLTELPLPFYGGAVGWLAYDLGRQFERLPDVTRDDTAADDIRLAWYDAAIVWDHTAGTMWLVGSSADPAAEAAGARLLELITSSREMDRSAAPPPPASARSNMSRSAYMANVTLARAGIERGEFYQLNLVQRFTCPLRETPAATYNRLRTINPAPFAAFIDGGDIQVLSSSPERFLAVTPTGQIRTCPIKGTRPRSASTIDDERHRRELLSSEKERAELLMIVDLLRNDLGRVCTPGSVQVNRLHSVESFATVHHLVGEVQGQLSPGTSPSKLLRAVFPGGSITGAPKVSAMAAIERLEPHRRGIAMGSLGFFSAHGAIDLNIAIRTIVVHDGTAYVSVGAGIVWDSEPAAEYDETITKARALFEALGVTAIEP